jgi:hypothetical protein
VRILSENAGIQTSALIPSMNALIPLVALLGRQRGREFKDADAIVYWLFGAFLTARFSAAADTKIAQDALAVRTDEPVRAIYGTTGLLGAPLAVREEQLIGKGAGSPYFLLSYLVAKRRHAKDWWHDVEISESRSGTGFAIEYHHIHPRRTLRDDYSKGEINDLANLAFISATANKKIRDRPPHEYFPELLGQDDGDDQLTPHLVPTDEALRAPDAYRRFLVERRRLLADAMTDLVASYQPEWVSGETTAEPAVERSVSITLYAGPGGQLLFEAVRGQESHRATVGHAALERFLQETEDGVATEVAVGGERAVSGPEAEEIRAPVGPFEITGSVAEWRAMLARELEDARPIVDLPPVAPAALFDGDREPFPVSDAD